MKKKLANFVILVIMLPLLLFSRSYLVFADEFGLPHDEYEYLFLMVLRSCGISPINAVSQWSAAYKGYLESTNNTAMLNQINGYANLSWGDTATNVDKFAASVKGWLSKSDSYGTSNTYYYLPSKPAALPSSAIGTVGIQSTPFTDVNTPTDTGYKYLFSDSYNYTTSSGRVMNIRRNVYAPSDKTVFAICQGYNTTAGRTLKFYCIDSTNSKGYSAISVQSIATSYWVDTGAVNGKDTKLTASWQSKANCHVSTLMNLTGIPVFNGVDCAEEYVKTGVVSNVYTNEVCALFAAPESYGTDVNAQNNKNVTFGNSVKLPSSQSAASDAYVGVRKKISLEQLSSGLKAGGFDISYQADYTIEHYKQNESGFGWKKEETEKQTGVAGAVATVTPKSYAGFTYVESLTEPSVKTITSDGKLVVKLYYERNKMEYVVEHYKQNVSDSKWEKAETETLTGLFGADAVYSAKSYPGFTFQEGLTEPEEKIIPLNGKLVIKLYYTRNKVDYSIEYYKQDVTGNNWEKFETETGIGLFGAKATYIEKSYPGFTFQKNLTEPEDKTIPADSGLVIKLYYKRNQVAYTVEHYRQDVAGTGWELADTETKSGLFGATAVYLAKVYSGFTFQDGLTEPKDKTIPVDNGLVIRLYYSRNQAAYTLEHYRQDIAGTGWELVDAEIRSGLFGATAVYLAKVYPGFTFQENLTEPKDKIIPLEGGLVIKLYYKRDVVDYTVEHYQGAAEPGKEIEWNKVESENLSGLFGTIAAFEPKNYAGYTYQESMTEPEDKTILADGSLVIKLYYEIPYEASVIQDTLNDVGGIMSPGAIAGIGLVGSGLFGTIVMNIYKRSVKQAAGVKIDKNAGLPK